MCISRVCVYSGYVYIIYKLEPVCLYVCKHIRLSVYVYIMCMYIIYKLEPVCLCVFKHIRYSVCIW